MIVSPSGANRAAETVPFLNVIGMNWGLVVDVRPTTPLAASSHMRESDVHEPVTNLPTVTSDPSADPAPAPAPQRFTDTRTWLAERIDGRVAAAVGISWYLLTEIIVALEPRAQFELPLISVILTLSMYSLLVAMVAGLVMGYELAITERIHGICIWLLVSGDCNLLWLVQQRKYFVDLFHESPRR